MQTKTLMPDYPLGDQKPSILVVDDEETIVHILQVGLQQRDYRVFTASHAEEAKKVAEANTLDYTLIDIKLPDMNGIELVAELKRHFPKINHILMTGYPGIKSAIEALRHQVCDYLIKPFHIDQVCAIIKRVEHEQQLEAKHAVDHEMIQRLQQENEMLKQRLKELMPDESRLKKMVLSKYSTLTSDEENALHSYSQHQGIESEKKTTTRKK